MRKPEKHYYDDRRLINDFSYHYYLAEEIDSYIEYIISKTKKEAVEEYKMNSTWGPGGPPSPIGGDGKPIW